MIIAAEIRDWPRAMATVACRVVTVGMIAGVMAGVMAGVIAGVTGVWLASLPTDAAAQTPESELSGDFGDSDLDPLAFFRIDTEARGLTVTVENRASGDLRRVSARKLLQGTDELYLRSATVAAIFQASRSWEGPLRRLTLRVREQEFNLTAGSRLVVQGKRETLLPVPVLAIDGDLWLPMVFLTDLLGPRTRLTVLWNADTRRLAVGSAEYNIVRVYAERLTRATALHVLAKQPLSYRAVSTEPGIITLKIYGGEADPAMVSRVGRRGLLHSLLSRQQTDHVLLTLEVSDLVGRFHTYTQREGREIVLVLEEERVAALPDPVPRGRVNVMAGEGPVDVTHTISVRTVVIDPGHGGDDVGTVGNARGIYEKDVNLAVALELRRYLERKSDLKVVMTREGDIQMGLAERAELANQADGDLFISLHCNGWFNEGATGLETYFLSPAKSDWTKSVEQVENEASAIEEEDDVQFIVWELVQNQFISSSSDLAEVVQAHSCRVLGIPNRGVRQAGFRVLVGAYMPAVLVEMGFLSNSTEESRLAERGYQQQLALAMGEAILRFKAHYDRGGGQERGEHSAGNSDDPVDGGGEDDGRSP